jgi:uncharacterized protein YbaR (Trm112 family)
MAFELKVIDRVHCPRCNGKAELRIDQKKTDTKWVLVYVVCPVCRLNRYMYSTTKKAIINQQRIKRLKNAYMKSPKKSRVLRDRINKLENESSGTDLL